MKISIFEREYTAKENTGTLKDKYPLVRAEEDNLRADLCDQCLETTEDSSRFLWQKPDKTITMIYVETEPKKIINPKYTVTVRIKTMQGEHSEGLLRILKEKDFRDVFQ